ncbi:hypothetical protein [Myxacorys almedinensis]|uniref:Uncharacterized protein n=1 Tax=Myxacorys almedinensis A TaxID=2690445 RepID=A0A8J8CHZ5_9CYAN|nr:hypothetical protein [Myxacorys almedinensis]NDJ17209.1 hypothetical protein [Myxacorys almedinensis A]
MKIIVCPGMHSPRLTDTFIAGLDRPEQTFVIFPSDRLPVYSPHHILEFLQPHLSQGLPLLWIGFSAGVVGAIAAATQWQTQGGITRSLIAIDGWGVPLYGNFPIYRLSHDYFTHWSSALLGRGSESFYADPPVEHLDLWRSPNTIAGYWIASPSDPSDMNRDSLSTCSSTTAAAFVATLIDRYTD